MGLLFDPKLVQIPHKGKKRACECAEAGCETCPLRKKQKIINIHRIKGKKIAVWAEAPGGQEEHEGLELVGKAGQLLWNDAEMAGFSRDDCDIQNVVRCRPTQISEYGNRVNRPPTEEELWHCMPFNTKALTKMRAKVHLVLGQVAARTLLGKEYRKDRTIFWSDRLQAKVICTFHPAYFLRGFAGRSKRRSFRDALKTVASEAMLKKKGRYAYVESMDYKSVEGPKIIPFLKKIRRIGHKRMVVFDLEYGKYKGEEILHCVGVTFRPGHSRTVYLDHPGNPTTYAGILDRATRRQVINLFREIMEDPSIKKSFHYGVSDCEAFHRILGIRVRGFKWDTHFSEYIAFSGRKAYGLAEIAEVRYPQFAGYKTILDPWKDDKGHIDFSKIPRNILTLYNSADADLGCRIYRDTRKRARYAIVKAYTYASFTVERMQRRGPLLDFEHYKLVERIVPARVKDLENKLQVMARNPSLNLRSPKQVAKVMYEKLKIPKLKEKRKYKGELITTELEGTAIEILDVLGLKYPFPRTMALFRRADSWPHALWRRKEKEQSLWQGHCKSSEHSRRSTDREFVDIG